LVTLVIGLVEATHFADRHGLDLQKFAEILGAGPMASDVSGVKSLRGDLSRQASISDVLKNSPPVFDAAREASIASPLLDGCETLYNETDALGLGIAT
jgi:3-hydroxyisobutyrate dehydrogenase